MSAIIIVMLLGLLTAGFGKSADSPGCLTGSNTEGCRQERSSWQPVSINGVQGVIIPADYAPRIAWPYVNDEEPSGWTIRKSDLIPLEAKIGDFMITADVHRDTRPDSLDRYYRQYAGIIDQCEKKILVNAFCSIEYFEDWQNQFIEVDDGGTCYFKALYNTDTEQFEWFSFNGSA